MSNQPAPMQSNSSPWTEVYDAAKAAAAASTTPAQAQATKTPAPKTEEAVRAAQEALNNAYNLPH